MNLSTSHILLVDEDVQIRRLFGGKLASAGFEVLYAKSGFEGREMARKFHPNLILIDVNIPGINGIELAERLRVEPETADIPIIFLTNADLSIESEKTAKEMGIADYIQKGVDLDEFIERVKKVLKV